MRAFGTVLMIGGLLVIGSPSAFAQDDPSYGLTMGYPSGVGLLVPVNENVAVRPSLAFSWSSTDSYLDGALEGLDISISGRTLSLDVALLFYMNEPGPLRTYIAPAFTYEHVSVASALADLLGDGGDVGASEYGASGSFGAQYAIGPRFEVFGEAGLAFSTSSRSDGSSKAVRLRSGVGVILRF